MLNGWVQLTIFLALGLAIGIVSLPQASVAPILSAFLVVVTALLAAPLLLARTVRIALSKRRYARRPPTLAGIENQDATITSFPSSLVDAGAPEQQPKDECSGGFVRTTRDEWKEMLQRAQRSRPVPKP